MIITGVFLGYCTTCQQPNKVALLALPGWHHHYASCANCLSKIVHQINARSPNQPPHGDQP